MAMKMTVFDKPPLTPPLEKEGNEDGYEDDRF